MPNFTHAALHKTQQTNKQRKKKNNWPPKINYAKKKEEKRRSARCIHIFKVLDHAKTLDSGSLSTFGLQMLKKAEREFGSALCVWGGGEIEGGWSGARDLRISWSGEAMRSGIRML